MAGREGWLEERIEISKLAWLGTRIVPRGIGWWYTLGSATLVSFLMLILSGSFLMMNYSPSPDHAWDSVQYISNVVPFGSFIRSLHHWSAYAMILLIGLHALRVFFMAAYRYPRELNWVIGVFLLLEVSFMSFTGYLLPWDQKAYWATTVASHIAGETPVIGSFVETVLIGGTQIGAVTLTRFFTLHVVIIPALIVLFISAHIMLVIKLGISPPPGTAKAMSGDYES
ncbi:MAG: cytochrome b N-terminal domain-containing protein [Dehalococcoidales bacterium]|nr:cytochrome b N-terminal domain-containing protein [Dehalococcoidales bacterium]